MSVHTAQEATGLTPPDIYLLNTVLAADGWVEPAGQTRIKSTKVDRDRLDALHDSGHVHVTDRWAGPRVEVRITGVGRRSMTTWDRETGR